MSGATPAASASAQHADDPTGPTADDFDPFAGGGPTIERVIATSAAQREIWLADKLGAEASLAFNESVTLHLDGRLDLAALAAALAALRRRHAALRATIGPDGLEMLIEAPGPGDAPALAVHDLRTATADEQDRALAAAALRSVETPFDLERGPLFRADLHRLADERHRLLLAAHHIVCDGWSWGVVAEDLATLYAESLGLGPAPPPADDYADYVAHGSGDSERSDGDARAARIAAERYWLDRFAAGPLPVLDLPTDRRRSLERRFESRRIDHRLPASLGAAVQRLGADLGIGFFATLFAGFATMLQRLAGASDLVVGVPSAGQATSGLTRLVGHCVHLLPVRTDPDPVERFEVYARRAGAGLLDAFEHASLTWGALLARLPVERQPGRLPLVSVMFNVDRSIADGAAWSPGLTVSLRSNPRRSEIFELFLNAVRLDDGAVALECQYRTDLFDAETIGRRLRSYETLLDGATRDPAQPLGELHALALTDAQALAALRGRVESAAPGGRMHDGFVASAADAPDRIAVRDGDRTLTYRELDRRSNRLARALRRRDVGRGSRVGLCLPRDDGMLVALLGILKSGASYVPLDPSFPPARRLRACAGDAGLDWLVTDPTVGGAPRDWRPDATARILDFGDVASWADEPADPIAAGAADATPADAAYVIYTSGSTGEPKGVCVPHGAVANFLDSMRVEPGFDRDDRFAAVTTLSFDIAVLELLGPLAVGAEVVLVPRETAMDGPLLRALLEARCVTAMQATPGLWRGLLDAGWRGGPGFKALVGGESLPADLALDLLGRAGQVWNLYGPTETTVWSTAWRVDRATLLAHGVSIGRPIANTTIRIRDGAGGDCPIGVAGEICIGGRGVALGYLGRPEPTAERFVADPSPPWPGARLYRTGDRGRWRNDGLLEHLGRLDFQVKVRGYRIELGEIEAACGEWPGVAQSVVVAREDHRGDVRLVAYLVLAPAAALDEESLRAALRRRLPDYMLPQHVVVLAALPRLPNGKIDRRALPAPAAGAEPSARARVGPRSERERVVLAAMEAVLKLPELGVDDDFFALGGHSLLAARLAARLGSALGWPLPLRTVFDAPTAAGLAAAIDAADAAAASRAATVHGGHIREPLRPAADARRAPLTPMQERIRFIEELHPGRPTYNTPSAHRLTGPLDVAAFGRAFAAFVQRHPALRTVVALAGAGHDQLIAERIKVDLPLIDLRAEPDGEREVRLLNDIRAIVARPLDIHVAPLFHAVLFRLADAQHVFLFVPHHLIWDGWSFDVFYQEMAALYPFELAAEPGAAPVVPPPPALGFPDYAHWYRRWLGGAEAQAQLAWWRKRFAGIDAPHALATDRPRSGGMIGAGGWVPIEIDAELTGRLRRAANGCGITVGMLAMLALAALLGRLTRSNIVVLGVPVRGRQAGDLERTVGFFNNLLPLPIDVDPAQTLAVAAARLKNDSLDAMAHQDVPFEWLSTQPEVAGRSSASGLYQAACSFQDFRERQTRWGPLAHERLPIFQDAVTEELGVWLAEHESGMSGAVTYDRGVFDHATAEALREALCLLFRRIADADPALSTLLELRSPAETPAAQRLSAMTDRAGAAGARARAAVAAVSGVSPAGRPPTGREAVLARVWADLLSIDVGIVRAGDNFFDLGGDSLLAMRAVEAGAKALGERVDARRYIYESLAQIAATANEAAVPAPAAPWPRGGLRARLRQAIGLDPTA